MSSRFRIEPLLLGLLAACTLLVVGCERERREFHAGPAREPLPSPRLSTLKPGQPDPSPDPVDPVGVHYANNAFHVSQGSRLYRWFNCNGCHASGGGGGGMGPALSDDEWRYGGRIDQVHATILEGRPNGMPSWRGKMTDQQAWQLSAYVLSLSGNIRKDAAPSRSDTMLGAPPPTQTAKRERKGGNEPAAGVPGP
jgi:cytochrome c oxidase cbb3-type subunit 3